LGLPDNSRIVNYDEEAGVLNANDEINTPAADYLIGLLVKIFDLKLAGITLTVDDTFAQPDLLYYYFLDGRKYNVYGDMTIVVTFDTNTLVTIKVRPVVRRDA
jgi:hypothetical protein